MLDYIVMQMRKTNREKGYLHDTMFPSFPNVRTIVTPLNGV